MRLLKDFDLFKEYYNIDTKQFCSFENLQKIIGIYKIIDGIMTGLLVEDDNLYFLYDDDKYLITESYTVLNHEISKHESEFNLFEGNDLVVRFIYPVPDVELNISLFVYVDDDDLKWGNFIADIVNNPERKRNYILNLMEGE